MSVGHRAHGGPRGRHTAHLVAIVAAMLTLVGACGWTDAPAGSAPTDAPGPPESSSPLGRALGLGDGALDHPTLDLIGAIGDLTGWVLGGVALVWLLRLLVLLVEMSPLPAGLKRRVLRLAPIVELVVAVAYAASALVELLVENTEFAWVFIAVVVAIVVFSWSVLYDLVLGVAFRVAQTCQVGDLVQVDDVEGRVLEVGTRALVIQTRDGDEAVVNYGRIGRRTLRRTQSVSGAYVHSFVLDQPADDGFARLQRRVVEAAMRCHWASAVHEAKVERRAGGMIEVSIFAHDPHHAPIVEMAVRQALAADPAGGVGRVIEPGELPGAPGGGAPQAEVGEDPSEVMDLAGVLGPGLPPPPPTWK